MSYVYIKYSKIVKGLSNHNHFKNTFFQFQELCGNKFKVKYKRHTSLSMVRIATPIEEKVQLFQLTLVLLLLIQERSTCKSDSLVPSGPRTVRVDHMVIFCCRSDVRLFF